MSTRDLTPLAPRQFAPDFIRATAISLVVLLHATGSLTRAPGLIGWCNLTTHTLTRISVPLFLLLSGGLILAPRHDEEPVCRFLFRHLLRIILPLLIWSAIYAIWRIGYYGEAKTMREWTRAMVNGDVYYHLWFLYALIPLYCLAPLLRALLAGGNKPLIRLLLVLWFLAITLPPIMHQLLGADWPFGRGYAVEYLGYFLLGGLLMQRPVSPGDRLFAIGAFAAGLLATVIGSWLLTASNAQQNPMLHSYLRPNIVLMSSGAFLLLLDLGQLHSPGPGSLAGRIVALLAGCSLGIYLLHPMVIELGANGFLGPILRSLAASEAPGRGVFAAIALLISGAIIFVIRQIPGARRIVS